MKTFTPHPLIIPKLLDGSATQIRVPMGPQPYIQAKGVIESNKEGTWLSELGFCQFEHHMWPSPFGKAGDVLECLEEWCPNEPNPYGSPDASMSRYDFIGADTFEKIGGASYQSDFHGMCDDVNWNPAETMPAWASRVTLHVERVWVERLQDLSLRDAVQCMGGFPGTFSADGDLPLMAPILPPSIRKDTGEWWNAMYPENQFNTNPWCFAAEVRVEKND